MTASILAVLRAHPRHVVLAGLVAGLLVGPRVPVVAAPVAGAAVLAAGAVRLAPLVVALLAVAILGGAIAAHARLQALDQTALRSSMGQETTVRATLLEAPRRTTSGGERALIRLTGGMGRGETVLARVPGFPGVRSRPAGWAGGEAGDEVVVGGTFQRLRAWDAWARTRGAHAVLRVAFARTTGQRRGGLAGLVDAIRRRAEQGLDAGLAAPEAALARGMVLGQDERLAVAARQDFQRSGLAHILAASGQNVMLLAALALPLLAWGGLGLRARLAGVLLLVALYVPLAGAGPSIQRAGVMGAAGLVAAIAGRRSSRWYALLLAAALTLLIDPRAVQDPGWQLSFAAVVSILAAAAPLRARLTRRGVPRGLAEAMALTAAATLGTAPLLAHHFDRVSLVSLPANLLAAPAIAPAMWLGMLAGACAQVAEPVARLLDALALYPLGFLEWLAGASAAIPGASVSVRLASWWLVAAAYAVPVAGLLARRPVLAAWRRAAGWCRRTRVVAWTNGAADAQHSRRRRWWAGPVLAVGVVAGTAALAGGSVGARRAHSGPLTVSFLDVGQGDATLIQDHGHAVLFDAGPPQGPILERLRQAGATHLDLLVVTHDQADHEGGAPAVLRAHRTTYLLDGGAGARTPGHEALTAAASTHGARTLHPERGQVLRAGRIRIAVLWPPNPVPDPHGDPNNRAIVATVSVGAFELFLPADAESDVTDQLQMGHVEVLKLAHHGSADPGLPALLTRLRPQVAVIEVGRHNPYGHPAAQALAALEAQHARTYRTDRNGTVALTVTGRTLRVFPQRS